MLSGLAHYPFERAVPEKATRADYAMSRSLL